MALTDKLSAIGDAIREKTGGTSKLTLDQMAAEIGTIQGGEVIEVESHRWEDWYLTQDTSSENIDLYENDRITKVREYGFAGCSIKNISLPNVITVANHCFYSSKNLISVSLPKCTEMTVGNTFNYCNQLKTVDIPLITKLGSQAFANCFSLVNIELLKVTAIGVECFNGCSGLESVNLPQLKTAGNKAFIHCRKLVNIDLPNLTTIGEECFNSCSVLESVNLPLLRSLRAQEFNNCKALKKIDLPSVTTLSSKYSFGNYGPFSGCSALETVILRNNSVVTLQYSKIFADTLIASGTGYVYVPASLVDSYKTATNWVTIADQIRAIEDYPNICG